MNGKNGFLIIAALCSGTVAVLHAGCIIFGGDWYRFLGAGEQMAVMADAGDAYPTIVTSVIVVLLTSWAAYALSGAGVIFRLPLLRTALCLIATVYILRGVFFVPLMPIFPGNSVVFWLVSSMVCLAFGLIYAVGIKQSWEHLGPEDT